MRARHVPTAQDLILVRALRSHRVEARHPLLPRLGYGVEYQFPADPALHPVRIDEEVFELADLSGGQHRGEADDAPGCNGDPCPTLVDGQIGEDESVPMSKEIRPIAVVRERDDLRYT